MGARESPASAVAVVAAFVATICLAVGIGDSLTLAREGVVTWAAERCPGGAPDAGCIAAIGAAGPLGPAMTPFALAFASGELAMAAWWTVAVRRRRVVTAAVASAVLGAALLSWNGARADDFTGPQVQAEPTPAASVRGR